MFSSRNSNSKLPFFKGYSTKKSSKQKQKWFTRLILLFIILFFLLWSTHKFPFSSSKASPPTSSTELHYNETLEFFNKNQALEVKLPKPDNSVNFKELTIARETKLESVGDRIPKIVHFVYGLRDPEPTLDLIHYIAIKAAHDVLKPEKIMFHYHHIPVGENFERARPMLTLRQVPMVTTVFDRPVTHYAHRADVVRLQVLEEFGGIYLDLDLIPLKSVDHLLDREFVMAQEGPFGSVGLCNAMIMARPRSRFIQRWYNTYSSFQNSDWNFHSVILPGKLAPYFPKEITVLNHTAFFWPLWDSKGLRTLYLEKSYDFSANLGTHIWESAANKNLMKDVDERVIMEIDNSLYCQLRPFLLDGSLDPRPNACRILDHTEKSDGLVGHWPLKEPVDIKRKETNPLPAIDESGNDLAGLIRNGQYNEEGIYLSGETSYIYLNLPIKTSAKSLTVSWWMKTPRQASGKMAMVVQTDHGRLCVKTAETENGGLSFNLETIKRNSEWAWEQLEHLALRPSPYHIDEAFHHYVFIVNENAKTTEPPIALYMDGHVITSSSDWTYPDSIGSIIRGIWMGSIEPLNDHYQDPWDNSVSLEAHYRDIRVWEHALSSTDVIDLYNSSKSVLPKVTKSKKPHVATTIITTTDTTTQTLDQEQDQTQEEEEEDQDLWDDDDDQLED